MSFRAVSYRIVAINNNTNTNTNTHNNQSRMFLLCVILSVPPPPSLLLPHHRHGTTTTTTPSLLLSLSYHTPMVVIDSGNSIDGKLHLASSSSTSTTAKHGVEIIGTREEPRIAEQQFGNFRT